MADSIVTVEKVSLKYKKTVLTDVTITAEKGDVIGLLGLNGSGKSTLLSAIAGLRRASSGTIKVGGKAGFVTQENALIDELTAMDNLKMWTPLSRAEILKTRHLFKKIGDIKGTFHARMGTIKEKKKR